MLHVIEAKRSITENGIHQLFLFLLSKAFVSLMAIIVSTEPNEAFLMGLFAFCQTVPNFSAHKIEQRIKTKKKELITSAKETIFAIKARKLNLARK